MGWFDEQIKLRKQTDDKIFSDSFSMLANAVLGHSGTLKLDERIYVKNAIDEILNFFGCKPKDLPDDITDFNEEIEYLCRPYGIMRRQVKLTDGWYKDAVGPFLGKFADSGKPVALLASSVIPPKILPC